MVVHKSRIAFNNTVKAVYDPKITHPVHAEGCIALSDFGNSISHFD
jgi:hypothetical protein